MPSGAKTLRQLGINNGPADFSLPADISISGVVDRSSVVTLIIAAPEATTIASYLRSHLPQMGFTITGDADTSLVFHNQHYNGAFTSANGVNGLTLRRR